MDETTLTALASSGGTALLGAMAFGARRLATVMTSRMRRRVEEEHAEKMARIERERDEARARLEHAAHATEREDMEAASEFQKTEALISQVHGLGKRLDRAEDRLDKCEAEKAECLEAIRSMRDTLRSEVRGEVRRTLSPAPMPATREDGEG